MVKSASKIALPKAREKAIDQYFDLRNFPLSNTEGKEAALTMPIITACTGRDINIVVVTRTGETGRSINLRPLGKSEDHL